MIKFDDYYNEKLKNKTIDLLKIDVEGYELEVIRGSLNSIKNTRYIHMEFNGQNYTISDLFRELNKSSKEFQLIYIRNFSNDTDSLFKSGDMLIKVL